MSSIAAAQEMTNCIKTARAVKPSTGIEGTYLLNTCDHPVFAFWCHEGTGGSACGPEEYFKRGRKMEPDERYFNKYSLPGNAAIHVGACSGTRRNLSVGGNGIGTYSCIKNDTAVLQPSDHTYINCRDGRKLSYQWRRKYVRGDVTIVRTMKQVGSNDQEGRFRGKFELTVENTMK